MKFFETTVADWNKPRSQASAQLLSLAVQKWGEPGNEARLEQG